MKRKILVFFLSAIMLSSMVACSGSAHKDESNNSTADEKNAGDEEASTDTSEGESEKSADENTDEDSDGDEDDGISKVSGHENDKDSSDSEADSMVAKEKIEAAASGIGEWESDYLDMAVSGDKSYTWAYIDMAYEDNFTNKTRNTFLYYCQLNFPNVNILEADGMMDADIQTQLVEDYISQGVDAIIIVPADTEGCVGIVDRCIEANMPLVVVNSTIDSDKVADEEGESGKVGFVGSSNYQAGQLQGEWIINNIDDSETVTMCYQQGAAGVKHTKLRQEGLFDTLDAADYNYELKDTKSSKYMKDIAYDNAEDWLGTYSDSLKCIPCCNDESALGTLQACQAAGVDDQVKILGIDADQDLLWEIKKGTIAATVYQDALGQAKWAAAVAYDACVNKKQETRQVIIPFEIVDATNVDDFIE